MSHRLLTVLLVLAASLSLVAARSKKTDDPVFAQIDGIVQSLSNITGLSELHPVPYGRMSKRQLRQFLNKRIKKTLKPEEIHADELALKMFGLVPQDFDLKKSTVDLLTEQAAAFYDYDEKKLFLLEGSSFTDETTTLAHELSHALADQHFDLGKFMEETPSNDDENLAHTAVVEGQASWLMIAYGMKQAGQAAVPTPEMLKSVVDSSDASMAEYPVLKGSPLYLQQSLLFPYTSGTLFFDAVYKKMGKKAFTDVFTRGPVASAEIIHPERYFAHEKPAKPYLPKLSLRSPEKEITEGSLGEFDLEMLIQQYTNEEEASSVAPHLRGGQFKIFQTGKQHKPVLEYVSEWDSEAHAAKFLKAYEKILRAKWKQCDVSLANETSFTGTGDNGYFVVHMTGKSVSSVEGLTDPTDWDRLRAAPAVESATKVAFTLKIDRRGR